MGNFLTAQICPNGHVATSGADRNPELRERFCSRCGEATLTNCEGCAAAIRGDYHVDGLFSFAGDYIPPAFCHNCGDAFPWTKRRVDGAVELLEAADLSENELQQFRADLIELTKDSPKVQAASLRFKKTMTKAGSAVASGVRDIVIDVFSEAAKRAIWGL